MADVFVEDSAHRGTWHQECRRECFSEDIIGTLTDLAHHHDAGLVPRGHEVRQLMRESPPSPTLWMQLVENDAGAQFRVVRIDTGHSRGQHSNEDPDAKLQ